MDKQYEQRCLWLAVEALRARIQYRSLLLRLGVGVSSPPRLDRGLESVGCKLPR
jgi:hypothetical protein